jgi:hypothetical protein
LLYNAFGSAVWLAKLDGMIHLRFHVTSPSNDVS